MFERRALFCFRSEQYFLSFSFFRKYVHSCCNNDLEHTCIRGINVPSISKSNKKFYVWGEKKTKMLKYFCNVASFYREIYIVIVLDDSLKESESNHINSNSIQRKENFSAWCDTSSKERIYVQKISKRKKWKAEKISKWEWWANLYYCIGANFWKLFGEFEFTPFVDISLFHFLIVYLDVQCQ